MLPKDAQIISVDDHVIEHPNVWQDRLPAKYKDVGPKLVFDKVNGDHWEIEGEPHGNFALNAVAGKPREAFGMDPTSYDEMRDGCHDVHERIKDMDIEGVWAELNFPNMPGFAGSGFATLKDKDLAYACVQAYNDFILDEWCPAYPDRLIPLTILPYWDSMERQVAEIHRTADKGTKSIAYLEAPHRLGIGLPSWHSDHWNPLLQAVQDRDLPLSVHFGSGGFPLGLSDEAVTTKFPVTITSFGFNSAQAAIELIWSPIFDNYPGVKFVLSESGIGWVPYVLERADYVWERHRSYNDVNRDVKPSDRWYSNMYAPFIADDAGIEARHRIGVENIMFESDYPHSDCNWPHTRKMLEESLANVPDDEARLIAEGNARRVYNFPRQA
ncbi:MAG: amidohydrolase family protein [Candidatus Nanopelagicales bacterium]|nr:amidohydrolase family protein [Candidatus Nanopelagicales bacterium]